MALDQKGHKLAAKSFNINININREMQFRFSTAEEFQQKWTKQNLQKFEMERHWRTDLTSSLLYKDHLKYW